MAIGIIIVPPAKLNLHLFLSPLPSYAANYKKKSSLVRAYCAPLQWPQQQQDVGIMCEPCNGKGWLVCDFCKGQKTNVKAENNRIYRRCPSCRASGFVLCSNCKVFKCVTFPDYGVKTIPSKCILDFYFAKEES